MPTVEDFVIDFGKEESGGGGGIHIKEDTYKFRIIGAKPTVSGDKGTPGLELKLRIIEGSYAKKKGKNVLTETLWVSPKAFSRFRLLLEACGKKVPAKIKLTVIAKAVKGCEIYAKVEDDAREGYSTRSRIAFQGFFNPDDYEPEDEEEEEDEDLEDEDDEDLEDEDEDEEEEDEDLEDEDDEDEDEEEEEEEPEPPKRKTRRRTKKAAPAAAKKRSKRKAKPKDDDEDEDLEDLDLEDL